MNPPEIQAEYNFWQGVELTLIYMLCVFAWDSYIKIRKEVHNKCASAVYRYLVA